MLFEDAKKRQASNLGALSSGRVGITTGAAQMLRSTLPIVVRYSAARKQFGPENSTEEWPVLEYPLQVCKTCSSMLFSLCKFDLQL